MLYLFMYLFCRCLVVFKRTRGSGCCVQLYSEVEPSPVRCSSVIVVHFFHSFTCLFVCLFICLYLFICMYVCMFVCLHIYLYVLFNCLFVCMFIRLLAYLFFSFFFFPVHGLVVCLFFVYYRVPFCICLTVLLSTILC